MSKADKMFNELGMIEILNNDDIEIYRLRDDYKDYSIHFNKDLKSFYYHCSMFLFKDQKTWEEMKANNEFRDDFDKHCATYGHWTPCCHSIGIELLKAINEKVKELGWEV